MRDIKHLENIKAKFKLLKNQQKGNIAFVKRHDLLINKELRINKFKSKIIKVDVKSINIFLKIIKMITFQLIQTKKIYHLFWK